ncbi:MULTISPECIES: DUF1269 domain-containing protein [Flexivirga]|nr:MULTISPECIES: DUF1269 domain-containing protein [Flexivirga]
MADNVILMTWPDQSKAYQAYSDLNALSNDGAIDLVSAAVVQRNPDGTFTVKDGDDNEIGSGTLGGSVIGMLVGVLGGPLGMLLGWAGGALVGGTVDAGRAADTSSVVADLSRAIPPGVTGLIGEVKEGSPAAVDQLAQQSGATLERRPLDEVMDEVAEAEDAAIAAADAADRKLHEEKKAERKADRKERLDKIKAKLHV